MELAGLLTMAVWVGGAAPPPPSPLNLSMLPDEGALVSLLWQHSPELAEARTRIAAADADLIRAQQLPNPSLDLGWNTVPVDRTNPPGLRPLVDVPNYTVTLSELVELGKRGPRREAARGFRRAAALDVYELLRQRTLDLRERVAEVASAEVRVAALSDAAADAAKLTELQQARASRGDVPGLDVDRALLEQQKLESNVGEARERLRDALLACSQAVGVPCLPFAAPDRANAYLASAPTEVSTAGLEARPDLGALAAQESGARSALTLARRRAIPDLTLRAGYVRDRFVISGNQPQSMLFGVSLPLPLFDRGGAEAREASQAVESSARARALLTEQGRREVEALRAQLLDVNARKATLHHKTLPLARDVVSRLEQSVRAGTPVQDLLLARRTLEELLADTADVDLTAFHTTTELARTAGYAPNPPADLRAALSL